MGRPQFENITTISATTSKKMAWVEDLDYTPLTSGTYKRVTIFSPPNTISTIKNVFMNFAAIPGQVAGVRTWFMENYILPTVGIGLFYSEAPGNYTASYQFEQGSFKYSDDTTTGLISSPTTATVNSTIQNTKFDDLIGITFVFRQTSGVSTGATERRIILFTEQETVKR